ncbi:MAG: M48 family metalloprotease [Fimbriimonadaceae bacterium]
MLFPLAVILLRAPSRISWGQQTAPPVDASVRERELGDEAMGKKFAAEVAKQTKPTADPQMQARVERIGNELAAIANSHPMIATWGDKRFTPFHYHFTVLKGEDVNAFSLPGGYIYVYEGLVKYVESDDELAGVLAHEISHAAFRHVPTLIKNTQKLNLVTLPLILASIFMGGGQGAALGPLVGLTTMAIGSGWSVEAEKAADYGGFQILTHSKYNPVGMLTCMERFARDEHMGPAIEWGIYRDHPPSRERAEALTADLEAAHIPIRRSLVCTSYRATVLPSADGLAVIVFDGQRLHGFAGDDALQRADAAVEKLNEFFDVVPELYEARVGPDGNIYGRNRLLITITDADAEAAKMTRAALAEQTLSAVRGALFTYGDRVWQSQG